MKIKYIKKPKINDFDNPLYTYNKEYKVLADYRSRISEQKVPDNGLVIYADNNQQVMVFLADGFEISDSEICDTYVFKI